METMDLILGIGIITATTTATITVICDILLWNKKSQPVKVRSISLWLFMLAVILVMVVKY